MNKQYKRLFTLGLMACLSVATSMIVLAGEWKEDETGWWYEEDDSTFPKNQWKEINGKQYYFDGNGYMLHDTTTPDGYKVGTDGAWVDIVNSGKKQNFTASYGQYSINPLIFEEMDITAGELLEKYGPGLNADGTPIDLYSGWIDLGFKTSDDWYSAKRFSLYEPVFDKYYANTYTVPKKEYNSNYDLNHDGVVDGADSLLAYEPNNNTFANEISDAISEHRYFDMNKSIYGIRTKGNVLIGFSESCSVEELGRIVTHMGATNVEVVNETWRSKNAPTFEGEHGNFDGYSTNNRTSIEFQLNGLMFSTIGYKGEINIQEVTWSINRIK